MKLHSSKYVHDGSASESCKVTEVGYIRKKIIISFLCHMGGRTYVMVSILGPQGLGFTFLLCH